MQTNLQYYVFLCIQGMPHPLSAAVERGNPTASCSCFESVSVWHRIRVPEAEKRRCRLSPLYRSGEPEGPVPGLGVRPPSASNTSRKGKATEIWAWRNSAC